MRMFLTWLVPMALFALWFAWREGFITKPQDRPPAVAAERFGPPIDANANLANPNYVTTGAGQGVYIELSSDAENITITGNTVQSTQGR